MSDFIEINLPCGKVTKVSEIDKDRVIDLKWSDKGGGYVRARWSKKYGGDGSFIYLHRFVLSAPKGLVVDHIDGNPLNNTRDNLQIISQSRNCMKSKKAITGGVSYDRGKWRARMRVDGVMRSLGVYDSREFAQEVVDHYRRIIWDRDPKGILPPFVSALISGVE